MKINSVLLKSLVLMFLLHFLAGQANAQKDSTWYIFGDAQITLLNSFQTLDFSKDWTNSSEKTMINSFGAGILFRSRSVHKSWSGFNFSVSSTPANALFRSKYVSYVEQGRTFSYTSSEGLSLKNDLCRILFCQVV